MPILGAYMVPHPPMIVPEVGRGSEWQIEATRRAYALVAEEIARLSPETVIISSPHAPTYRGRFHISQGAVGKGSFARFGAPEAAFREEFDRELAEAAVRLAGAADVPIKTGERGKDELDHGTMVPLWAIHQVFSGFRLVRVGLSWRSLEDHYRLGQAIARAVEETGRRVVFVASGDLSHKLQPYGPYGFDPDGPRYDERIMDVCGRGAFGELLDFDEGFLERAAECGHRSFLIMAGALDGLDMEARSLSHEDVTGVGYGVCAFRPLGPNGSRRFLEEREKRLREKRKGEDAFVRLARRSVESYVLKREILSVPEGLPDELLHTRAGAFVSIHEDGRLRGCIGTTGPTRSCLAGEIIHNAVNAAVRDPRFDPIEAHELDRLVIHVDVLTEPEEISSEAELDVRRYGVIVSRGPRRGLLLPDLEGVDTVEQQVAIARQKAGIGPGEPVRLQRFEVIRHT